MASNLRLPEKRYSSETLAGTRIELPDGSDVVLERYESGRRVHFLWPTTLGIKSFFDAATGAIGVRYEEVKDNSTNQVVPKSELVDFQERIRISSVELPEDLGAIVWEEDIFTDGFIGGIISRHIGSIAFSEMMLRTGSEPVVANLQTILEQTATDLSL